MNAYSSEFHQSRSEAESGLADSIAMRWAALHAAAGAAAGLALIPANRQTATVPDFAALTADAPPWQVGLLSSGLDDIGAVMQSGLTALLTVNAAGRDPAVAAKALWDEFEHARDALLATVYGQQ